ncbi:MAG: type II toxin-antitoxin system VapC family toxin [Gemmatimonadales bacterium]|nr:type II toxin-antitoxin system VapC family toxin [Gemmatimonadales bacterium]
MVLVDTNIWINHFRKSNQDLVRNLNQGSVACHPFIIGELAAGNLKNRIEILDLFQSLPATPVVEPDEYLEFVSSRKLMGKGLGFVDIHILASAVLSGIPLWTGDKRLASSADDLGIAYKR